MKKLFGWDPFPGMKQAWTTAVVSVIALATIVLAVFGVEVAWLEEAGKKFAEYGYFVVALLLWFMRKKIDRGR